MFVPTRVVLMLKAPIAGFVKTRLAADIGDAAAAKVFKAMVEAQIEAIPKDWEIEVRFTPAGELEAMRSWLGSDLRCSAQVDGDLGVKMETVASEYFGESDGIEKRLIFLGGDCPGANEEALKEINTLLDVADVAIGPAVDGGYWSLSLRRFVPEVFQEIPWSSSETLIVTKSRLREAGISFALGRELEDVDDLESLKRAEDCIRS